MHTCFAAEVGLSGEIRAVNRIDQRISEAEKLGIVIRDGWGKGRAVVNSKEIYLNGDLEKRAAGFLNVSFNYVEGESLIMALKDIAVSSGSACTSASLEPSYVLRALGLKDELAHSSIRFAVGRFTTEEDINYTLDLVKDSVGKLREISPLWDMYKDGVDMDSIEWAAN